jgi:hypothetical protein
MSGRGMFKDWATGPEPVERPRTIASWTSWKAAPGLTSPTGIGLRMKGILMGSAGSTLEEIRELPG